MMLMKIFTFVAFLLATFGLGQVVEASSSQREKHGDWYFVCDGENEARLCEISLNATDVKGLPVLQLRIGRLAKGVNAPIVFALFPPDVSAQKPITWSVQGEAFPMKLLGCTSRNCFAQAEVSDAAARFIESLPSAGATAFNFVRANGVPLSLPLSLNGLREAWAALLSTW